MIRLWQCKAFVLCLSILLFCVIPVVAQESVADLKKEIEELKQGQQAIQKELSEIKSLLLRPVQVPGPPQVNIKGVEFEIGNNPVLGSDAAGLILVEFTDYQCPYCSRYVQETFPKITDQYVERGALRYAVIDQPLPIHPLARKAAEASHCANDQGKFWEMHKLMMSKQDSLKDLSSYAVSAKLDISEFENCIKTEKYKEDVGNDMAQAQRLGINGVPGFIIGSVDPQNPTKVKGISFIRGAMPFANFQKEIDLAMAAQKQ